MAHGGVLSGLRELLCSRICPVARWSPYSTTGWCRDTKTGSPFLISGKLWRAIPAPELRWRSAEAHVSAAHFSFSLCLILLPSLASRCYTLKQSSVNLLTDTCFRFCFSGGLTWGRGDDTQFWMSWAWYVYKTSRWRYLTGFRQLSLNLHIMLQPGNKDLRVISAHWWHWSAIPYLEFPNPKKKSKNQKSLKKFICWQKLIWSEHFWH